MELRKVRRPKAREEKAGSRYCKGTLANLPLSTTANSALVDNDYISETTQNQQGNTQYSQRYCAFI